MTHTQIALLLQLTLGGIGLALFAAGIVMIYVSRRRTALCIQQTEGIVVAYRFPRDGGMYPIIEYCVDGMHYRTRKRFRGFIVKQINMPFIHVEPETYEDEKGYLRITLGPVANLRAMAEQMWPMGTRMTVYYDPDSPKRSYVDRPIHGGLAPASLIGAGICLAVVGVIVPLMV